jgi:hypothetical protein
LELGDGTVAVGNDDALAAFHPAQKSGKLVFCRGYIGSQHVANMAI